MRQRCRENAAKELQAAMASERRPINIRSSPPPPPAHAEGKRSGMGGVREMRGEKGAGGCARLSNARFVASSPSRAKMMLDPPPHTQEYAP